MFFVPKAPCGEEQAVIFRLDADDVIDFIKYDRSRLSPFDPPPGKDRGRKQSPQLSKLLVCGFALLVVGTLLLAPPDMTDAIERFFFQFLGVIGGAIFVVSVALVNFSRFRDRAIRNEFARSVRRRRSPS